jgi:hypothetical protein
MNAWIRQIHRWTSIVFTLAVVANLAGIAILGQTQAAIGMALGVGALLPLLLLMGTGLYLFALPYARGGVA